MKIRVAIQLINLDLKYSIEVFSSPLDKWICVRVFDDNEREMAINYATDMSKIELNDCSKIQRAILMEFLT